MHSSEAARTAIPPSVLESELPPRRVFELSEGYLEYHLGYSLAVRDLEHGIIVSNWTGDTPLNRHQITLRIGAGERGSIVSAHIRSENLSQAGWQDEPSSGESEKGFLDDFQKYLSHKQAKN